jgi:hypothetical protein
MSLLRDALDRIRQPATRAAELRSLRRRLAAASRLPAGPAEQRAAIQARELREQLSDAIGDASTCAGCSVGCAKTAEVFPGGDCCSGNTEHVFDEPELVGLALSGTRARHLKAPTTPHAGCAFRGLRGCTLEAAHRPNRCLIYTCRGLRRELSERGDMAKVLELAERLEATGSARPSTGSRDEPDVGAGIASLAQAGPKPPG